jgi:hypothetical protein
VIKPTAFARRPARTPIPQLKKLEAGIVLFGHNWNDEQVLKIQKQNFKWFGWKTAALGLARLEKARPDRVLPVTYG